MANRNRDPRRERFWRDVLARFRSSGLSVRAFCRQEHLGEPLFYAWRRTIAERDGKPPATGKRSTVGKRSSRSRPAHPAFLPLVIRPGAPPPAGIVVELRGGRMLRLPESMPVVRVAELIRALEAGEVRS